MRAGLGEVDCSYHDYPYRVLFPGRYEEVALARMIFAVVWDLLTHRGDPVVLPGYDRVEYWVMLGVCMAARRKRLVFVDSTAYDRPKTRWKELAKRLFFASCDGFLCYGVRSEEYLLSYGVPAAKIYPGCQATALPHDYTTAKVQSLYEPNASAMLQVPRFIYVGRLAAEKGLHDLLEAFCIVRRHLATARLDFVGAGPLRSALENHVNKLGLAESVALLGVRDINGFAPMLAGSLALVLPSYSEPWGYVVNESLSYGCPVVVSDRCGCAPELVVDGVTGFTFATGNVEAMAAAMLATTQLSEDRSATATRCLKLMAKFTPERAAERMLQGCKTVAGFVARQKIAGG